MMSTNQTRTLLCNCMFRLFPTCFDSHLWNDLAIFYRSRLPLESRKVERQRNLPPKTCWEKRNPLEEHCITKTGHLKSFQQHWSHHNLEHVPFWKEDLIKMSKHLTSAKYNMWGVYQVRFRCQYAGIPSKIWSGQRLSNKWKAGHLASWWDALKFRGLGTIKGITCLTHDW